MNSPKVSVIIPAYNSSKYICETIDSVLAQTCRDFEIIVVDDGSTDNTREVLEKYGDKIKYIYQENKGVAAARNRGIKESKGDFLAFLDHDDIWKPNKLTRQVDHIEKNNNLGLVCSLMEAIDGEGKSLNQIKPKTPPGKNFDEALFRGSPYPTTYLIRRSCFENIGLFDESIAVYDDLDMYLRILSRYQIEILSEPLVYYRIHDSNTGHNNVGLYINQIKFSKKWLRYCHSRPQKDFLNSKILKYSLLLCRHYLKRGQLISFAKYCWIFSLFKARSCLLSFKEKFLLIV